MWFSGRKPKEDKCREKGNTEQKIIYALWQAEPGKKVSPQAFYSWKRKYAGLGVSELRELRQLREENRKLKRVRLRDLAASRVRYGYRRLTVLLRREGWAVNAKRVYRLYCEEGLQVRTVKRAKRAKRAAHTRVPLAGAHKAGINGEIFFSLTDAREKLDRWKRDYNQKRPHTALADRTPDDFARAFKHRPFALPIVNKAEVAACQRSAAAGQKPPAIDTPPPLPSRTGIKGEGPL
jgi:hypothetical protein